MNDINMKDINEKNKKDIYILGIETSCDETAASVVKNGREVLSNIINSQISEHEKYGGVVPEIASRMHVEAISSVVTKALEVANITIDDITAIAVTKGPGLVGALLVGTAFAKSLSYTKNIPLIGVNHLEGHVAANYITYPDLKPPFLSLIISGGHTHLVKVNDYNSYEVLGKTRDDAVGEAFDKVARVAGLGYPGGPKVDSLAKLGKPTYYNKIPKPNVDGYDFSFSGIKTAIINLNHNSKEELIKEDLCASLQEVVTEILIEKTKKALKDNNLNEVIVCGGVSANSYIRQKFNDLENTDSIKAYFPEFSLCTDNAAMIAAIGYYYYIEGITDTWTMDAIPNLKFGER